MTPEIGDTCIFLTSAKAIWDAMEQTYSKVRDGARIYELRTKIHRVRQGNMSITEYSNYLKGLWQELDHYQCIPIKASEEVKAFKIFMEKQRVYDFLAGLNPEYDAVRVQILGKEETLLNGAISIVLAEEGRRGVMMESQPTESSALMTKANVPRSEGTQTASPKAPVQRPEGTASTKGSLWCTYCKKPRHTKDTCWKLHGRPQNTKGGQGHAHVAVSGSAVEPTTNNFNSEEIEKLRSLLGTLSTSSIGTPATTSNTGTCSLVLSGKPSQPSQPSPYFPSAFNVSDKVPCDSWIIDSGASDHMTNSPHKFISYIPCPSTRKITLADGSDTTVAGLGNVFLNDHITLKGVLHVPKLCSSLISVHKLTADSKCSAIFHPTHCVFQEQGTKRMIGHAKEQDGLYYLETCNKDRRVQSLSSRSFHSLSLKSNKEKIWLYHLRLGHPSFHTLKVMFPDLFGGLVIEDFHCEVCELAKRVSFPISNSRTFVPFTLIHSDIWGPSTVSNISGARWFVTFIDDFTRVTWTYLLKQKSDVSSIFPVFYNMVQTQFGVKIQRFRSDNAKDFFNQSLSSFFQKHGIIHESSCVYTPQQNGIAERKNSHLLSSTRAILLQNHVSQKY